MSCPIVPLVKCKAGDLTAITLSNAITTWNLFYCRMLMIRSMLLIVSLGSSLGTLHHYVLIVSSMLWITIQAGGVIYLFALLISVRHSIK